MAPSSNEPPLASYAAMVWKRRILVILVTLAMAVPAYLVSSLETTQYQATAQILLSQRQFDENFNLRTAVLTDIQVNNLVAILNSTEVARQAARAGGTAELRAAGVGESNVVTISATDPDRQRTVLTIRSYIDAFSNYLTTQDTKALENIAQQLDARIDQLRDLVGSSKNEIDTANLSDQLTSLIAQRDRIKTQQGLVASGVMLVQEPAVPAEPISPTPIRNALLGLVLGLALGVSLAIIFETARRRSDAGRPTAPPPSSNGHHHARRQPAGQSGRLRTDTTTPGRNRPATSGPLPTATSGTTARSKVDGRTEIMTQHSERVLSPASNGSVDRASGPPPRAPGPAGRAR